MTLIQQLGLISPVLYLIFGGFVVLSLDLFAKQNLRIVSTYPYLCYLAIGLAGGTLWNAYLHSPPDQLVVYVFSRSLVLDSLYRILSLFFLIALSMLIFFAPRYLKRIRVSVGEYYALLMFSVSGMMLVVASNEFVTLFLSLEIFSIAIYILTGITRNESRTTEAAMKYFIMGAFATSFILYGLTLLYGLSGTLYLDQLSGAITKNKELALMGMVLVLIGLCFKIGAVPFHMWVPDVYEGAPTAVTAFMSVTVKAAGFGVFIRFSKMLFVDFSLMTDLLMGISILTMLVGNLYAVTQSSVKRMLAYSSIAHTGYALIGLTVFTASRDPGAISATLYYLLTYSFMTLGAFLFLIYLTRGSQEAETFEHFSGLARKHPIAAFTMSVFMLSLAGIPPTGGFFSKFYVFQKAIQYHFYPLVILGIVATMISLYYYLKVIVMMYMYEPTATPEDEDEPDIGLRVALGIALVFTLLLGLAPDRFLDLIARWSLGI